MTSKSRLPWFTIDNEAAVTCHLRLASANHLIQKHGRVSDSFRHSQDIGLQLVTSSDPKSAQTTNAANSNLSTIGSEGSNTSNLLKARRTTSWFRSFTLEARRPRLSRASEFVCPPAALCAHVIDALSGVPDSDAKIQIALHISSNDAGEPACPVIGALFFFFFKCKPRGRPQTSSTCSSE